jgi:hypothetical protein
MNILHSTNMTFSCQKNGITLDIKKGFYTIAGFNRNSKNFFLITYVGVCITAIELIELSNFIKTIQNAD